MLLCFYTSSRLCVDTCFHFSWINTWGEIAESYGNYMFNFIRNCEIVFQSSCTIWLSHQQCSSCSASSPTFGIDSLLRFSHSSFNLHFPGDWWFWTSFHMLVCHSYVFFGYVSVKIFDLFCFIVLFVFLLWNYKSSLYILDAILLLDKCFTDIFSQSVACLVIVFCVCVWFSHIYLVPLGRGPLPG